jgi:hypothetical protein
MATFNELHHLHNLSEENREGQKQASAGSTPREIFNRTLPEKILIVIATLPENLIRINRTQIEKNPASPGPGSFATGKNYCL